MLPVALRKVKRWFLIWQPTLLLEKPIEFPIIIILPPYACLEFALQIESAAARSFPNLEQGETKEIPSAVDEDTKTSAFRVRDGQHMW